MAGPSNQATIDKVDAELRDLRRLFDLYFQGIERFPPVDERDRLRTVLNKLRREASRWSTGDRFRLNAIHHKFTSYNQMWDRQVQAMENGTSRRDKMKVKLMRKREAEKAAMEAAKKREQAAAAQAGAAPLPPSTPAATPQRGQPAPRAAARDSSGMSDAKLERLYKVYMQAKKRTGESTNMNYESLARQIRKQIPAIKKKHGCKDVDFKVVLKNGKAMLKAVPK